MKFVFLWAVTVAAGSAAALTGACGSSSSDNGASSGDAKDASTSGSSGTSSVVVTDAGTVGAPVNDTCKAATPGNSCQCSCAITGQVENKTLHCAQPLQDTGECKKVCCTGPIDSGTSSTSSGGVDLDGGDSG